LFSYIARWFNRFEILCSRLFSLQRTRTRSRC